MVKKTNASKCGKECREKEILYTVGGRVNWYTNY
jgi:hypothetical protein